MALMTRLVPRAGFVLSGGASSRMGRDKALLAYRGKSLVEYVAAETARAAGSATLVGAGHCGLPWLADRHPGAGPLGGIETALTASHAEWNLIVACDLPDVTAALLDMILRAAEESGADCLIPAGPSGYLEPLCAAYHARCLRPVREALDRGVRKVTDGISALRVETWPVADSAPFRNVNTPEEWTRVVNG
jgi:molybdopterin-guanine dinucleotide biosynthesis protein A